MSRSGGIPGNSSGKTSGNSLTTSTSDPWLASSWFAFTRLATHLAVSTSAATKVHFLSFWGSQLGRLLGAVGKYLMLTQLVHSKNDVNALQFQDNEVGDKVYPLILRFTFGHNCLAGISPPEELTIIWNFSRARGRLCFPTYAVDMKKMWCSRIK
jgi:hypothetical protein